MYKKLVPEKVHYINFHVKIYLESFVSTIFIIYLELSTKVFPAT